MYSTVKLPLQDSVGLLCRARQQRTPCTSFLLLLGGMLVEVCRLHRGVPRVERSASDERVAQGIGYTTERGRKTISAN